MRLAVRFQWLVVSAVFLAIATTCGIRLWTLRMLYVSPVVRANAERVIRSVADERGWLLSNISIASLDERRIALCHRDRMPGRDAVACSSFEFPLP